MKKSTMKKSKFKKVISPNKAIVEVVVRQEKPTSIDLVPASALLPEQVGTKYMIPQNNWISEKQVLQMLQKTPKEHIYTRPGKGGKNFSYVTGHYVKKVLNFVFGWNWDFEVVSHETIKSKRGDQVIVLGKLTVKDDKGHTVTKAQFGRAEIKYFKDTTDPVDFGNDLKAATTDALKKCASELGIASDVYGMNEFKEVGKEIVVVDNNKSIPEKLNTPDEFKDYVECSSCGAMVSPQVSSYSKKIYKKVLCRNCQSEVGGKR